jgi:hypothetical protein
LRANILNEKRTKSGTKTGPRQLSIANLGKCHGVPALLSARALARKNSVRIDLEFLALFIHAIDRRWLNHDASHGRPSDDPVFKKLPMCSRSCPSRSSLSDVSGSWAFVRTEMGEKRPVVAPIRI